MRGQRPSSAAVDTTDRSPRSSGTTSSDARRVPLRGSAPSPPPSSPGRGRRRRRARRRRPGPAPSRSPARRWRRSRPRCARSGRGCPSRSRPPDRSSRRSGPGRRAARPPSAPPSGRRCCPWRITRQYRPNAARLASSVARTRVSEESSVPPPHGVSRKSMADLHPARRVPGAQRRGVELRRRLAAGQPPGLQQSAEHHRRRRLRRQQRAPAARRGRAGRAAAPAHGRRAPRAGSGRPTAPAVSGRPESRTRVQRVPDAPAGSAAIQRDLARDVVRPRDDVVELHRAHASASWIART